MSTATYRGTLTAISEVHHGGDEHTGNVRLLRTIKLFDPGQGRVVRLPIISGNAIRGVLRRRIMHDLLERIDYGPTSTKLHHALFSGGSLEGGSDAGALDLAFRRHLTGTVPPLALLGSAIGNTILPGQLICNMARPFCRETAWALRKQGYDDERLEFGSRSFRDFTFTTRHDDLRDWESGESNQMIVTFEYFAAGTMFAHSFQVKHTTPLLESTLAMMVDLWQSEPTIGGKAAGGFGQLEIEYDGLPGPNAYESFVARETPAIRETLDVLANHLEGRAKPGVDHAQLTL